MRKIFVIIALAVGVVSANAQSVDSISTKTDEMKLTKDIYPQQEDGDIYHGLTKKLSFDRMIPPAADRCP